MAANLKRLREARKLSLRDLAARLKEAGHEINPDGLNRAEKGTRLVNADELVALAVQLNVNPTALLLPFKASGEIELSGFGPVDASVAWDWADGKRPLAIPADDLDGETEADFVDHARPAGGYSFSTRAGMRRIAENVERSGGRVQRGDDGEILRVEIEAGGRWMTLWPRPDADNSDAEDRDAGR